MAFFASVAGLQIVGGELLIPLIGAWTADLHLAGAGEIPSGPVSVVIGNLTLSGSVYRWATYGGQTRARLVGGAGGWRTSIAAQGYGSNAGIQLSLILGDAAAACGETIDVPASVSVGNGYARMAFASSVAGDVLWQALSQGLIPGWYVDATGTTQATSWPATTIATPFVPESQRPDEGIVIVATEDYVSWMPGASFTHPLLQGSFTVAGVNYVWDDSGKFRFEVLTGAADRFLGTVQALVDQRTAPLRFAFTYEYAISNPTLTTIDATPTDSTLGLPELQGVQLRGSSIANFIPATGALCHIVFINGDPAQPRCTWCQADSSTGPSEINIAPNSSNLQPGFRQTDTVVSQWPPISQLAGSVGPAPFVGVIAVTSPAVGAGQTGSSIVKVG